MASCLLDFAAPRVPVLGGERRLKSIYEKDSEASYPDVAHLLALYPKDTDHYRIASDGSWDISMALRSRTRTCRLRPQRAGLAAFEPKTLLGRAHFKAKQAPYGLVLAR